MGLNPVKVIVIEGASGGSLKKGNHLNKLINSDDLQFQFISAIPSNKVSQHVKEDDTTEIFLKLSKEDHKSAGTLRQILEESPDSALFVRIDKNNQEFFNSILKSGSGEELLKDRQNNFIKPQEKEMAVEAVREKNYLSSHRTHQMFERLIQANPLATMIIDGEGTVKMWSPAAERIFGWKEKEVVGCFLPVVPDDQRKEFLKNIQSVIQGKRIMGLEVQRQRKGGIPIEVSVWGVPLSDSDGNRQGLFMMADITEKRKMEEAILRVQKFESLGILAGGLAHDFNNIMTAVLGNISMAKLSINEPVKLRITIDEAEKAALRAINLAQQLLTFAKGGGPVKKVTSIGELVKESAGFALRGSNVRFEYTLQNDLWTVEIDEAQISQVIHNLVFNAQQASPAGGTLHVKVENIHIESKNKTGLKKGPYVRISVKEFGSGSSKENILKVFNPNYTTNQNGSGLRFASACSIVRRHGGTITMDTDTGITLLIYLPAIPADAGSRLTIAEKILEESR